MIPLIGLTGPIGSGKDTMAAMLRASGFRALKFADPLYAAANAIDPKFHPQMAHKDKNGYLLDNPSLGTRRSLLEKMGTEFFRNMIHPNFWCVHMEETILSSIAEAPSLPLVISDVRFENEATMLRSLGGHIVHLKPNWPCETTGHASDSGVKFDTQDSILGLEDGRADKGYKQLLAIIKEIYGPREGLG